MIFHKIVCFAIFRKEHKDSCGIYKINTIKEGTNLKITNATQDHLDKVYDLMCELEEDELDKNAFRDIYYANLEKENIYYLIAVENGKVIGFISVHIQGLLHHASNIAEIQELIVTARSQKSGIGRMLFEKAKELAKSNNCYQLEVCCNQKRKDSHAFYQKQGMDKSHYKFTAKI